MADIYIKSTSKITVPKGATKKKKKLNFKKYFPKKQSTKTPKSYTKKRLMKRRKMYK